jgi:hypothetical protein
MKKKLSRKLDEDEVVAQEDKLKFLKSKEAELQAERDTLRAI